MSPFEYSSVKIRHLLSFKVKDCSISSPILLNWKKKREKEIKNNNDSKK